VESFFSLLLVLLKRVPESEGCVDLTGEIWFKRKCEATGKVYSLILAEVSLFSLDSLAASRAQS
jgi:hypothetical protein